MRILNKDALEAQKAAAQPPWWLLLAAYMIAAHGAWALWEGALLVAHWAGCAFDPTTPLMRIGYFGFTMVLAAAISVGMLLRYRGALFAGYRLNLRGVWRVLWVGALVGLPLAVYYSSACVRGVGCLADLHDMVVSGEVMPERRLQAVVEIYRLGWGGLGWGIDLTGVVLASITAFTFPFCEEWLFSGYVTTRLARRLPLLAVVPLVGLIFLAVHAPVIMRMGSLHNLLLIFLGGCSAVCARLWCGSWLAGFVAHLIINFGVFLFKWVIALIVFKMLGLL